MASAYFLASLIALCPVFCGVVESAIGTHSHDVDCGPSGPSQCPESADNCVCHGAVVSTTDGKDLNSDSRGAVADLDLFRHNPHPVSHLTWDGLPSGLAALGDSLTVRSYLQNFRC